MTFKRRTNQKQKRIQQLKRRIFVTVTSLCVITVLGMFCWMKAHGGSEASLVMRNTVAAEQLAAKVKTLIEGITPDEVEAYRLQKIVEEAQKAGYPEDVVALISKNAETAEFVEKYGELKNCKPAKRIEELKEGEIPKLLQWDERWGYSDYGTSILAVCGCGPTCLSMVVSGMTGDDTLTPVKMAEYGNEHHYINEDNDTYWIFMSQACQNWGVKCKEKIWSEKKLKKELQAGHPVICSVGPGDFTQTGHFIVLADYEDGKVIVHDPFSLKNTEKRWEYSEFKDQIKSMWTYYLDE